MGLISRVSSRTYRFIVAVPDMNNLLTCEHDHGYLLYRKSDHLNSTDEIKQLEYWPEESIDNHEKQPWVYWRNNPKTVRERAKILDKCREIIQSRQNDNHIPEWVWTDAETENWLYRNKDKLSVEKRYLLKQI